MKTRIIFFLAFVLIAASLAIHSTARAQLVTVSDQVVSPAFLSAPDGSAPIFVPTGTTIQPPLPEPLPFYLSPVFVDFSAFFLGF